MEIKELSVFFPAFNEEKNIKKTVLSAKNVLESIAEKWEIIVVDDGSRDKTKDVVEELAKGDERIKVVVHSVNKGYGSALKTGFEKAKYEWVTFVDSDGQFDFSEIKKFLHYKDTTDLILGYRLKRADSFFRRLFTWGWGLFPKLLFGLKVKDYSCGFKMIRKRVFESVQPLVGEEKVTQIELLVKAKKKGFRFAEVGVNHYPRKKGKATGANLSVVIKSVLDLLKLWRKID